MKFAHIADVHIGSWRDPKLKDFSTQGFIYAIDECIKEKVDFILIAGDLFNTALPGIDYIKAVIRKLQEVKKLNIAVYYIAGSHDYSPSGKTMLDIIEEAELGINVTKGTVTQEGKLQLEFTKDKKTGAKISGMIGKRGMLEKKFYEQLDKTNLESESGFKIFMFHTAIDEMKPEEMKEMISSPASFLPKGFDYYAGGHVHIVKRISLPEHGYQNLVYPGPIFPANFGELEKLGLGGFYIYDDGELIRKEVKIKEVISKKINVDKKTAQEATSLIEETFENVDVKDKIVLMRVLGKLKSGKSTDVDFKKIFAELDEKGAYFIMKNTSKVSSDEFLAVKTEHGNIDEVENKIINEHLGQIPNDFEDELQTTKELMKTFANEKNEGEKVSDYDSRIKKEAELVTKK